MPIVTTQLQHIAVVGAGYMGGGIAQVFAMAGLDVVIVDADPALTRRHLERLCREAEDFEAQGLFDAGSADLVRANLRAADSLPEAVAEADLIEEAVLEQPRDQGPGAEGIEAAARPHAIIGSNTSTLPDRRPRGKPDATPSASSACTSPTPPPSSPASSSSRTRAPTRPSCRAAEALVARTGKHSARVNDKAGFVLNRLQYACSRRPSTSSRKGWPPPRTSTSWCAPRSATGCRSSARSPSPTWRAWTSTWTASEPSSSTTATRLAAPEMLTELVDAGRYGVKQGGGFVIPAGDQAALIAFRTKAYAKLGQLLRELGPAPSDTAYRPSTDSGEETERRDRH